jgi:hypothetical protein
MSAVESKLRDFRWSCDFADALRAAECDASDTRSQSLIERSATQ